MQPDITSLPCVLTSGIINNNMAAVSLFVREDDNNRLIYYVYVILGIPNRRDDRKLRATDFGLKYLPGHNFT